MQRVVEDEIDVVRRLGQLGLTEEALRVAVWAGELARRSCTENHPRMYSGISSYAETTKVLRDELVPLGWFGELINGVEAVTNSNGDTAVVVCSGNNEVGNALGLLKSKYSKGVGTKQIIYENSLQLTLNFFNEPERVVIDRKQVWYLMIYRDSSFVRFELGLPVEVSESGVISEWKERILFPEISKDSIVRGSIRKDSLPSFDEKAKEAIVEISLKN